MSLLENSMVLAGRTGGAAYWTKLEKLIVQAGIQIVALDADLPEAARQAFLQFGKGRHPAGLNMGDCAAYALAKSLSAPLLSKDNDFATSDLNAAS